MHDSQNSSLLAGVVLRDRADRQPRCIADTRSSRRGREHADFWHLAEVPEVKRKEAQDEEEEEAAGEAHDRISIPDASVHRLITHKYLTLPEYVFQSRTCNAIEYTRVPMSFL